MIKMSYRNVLVIGEKPELIIVDSINKVLESIDKKEEEQDRIEKKEQIGVQIGESYDVLCSFRFKRRGTKKIDYKIHAVIKHNKWFDARDVEKDKYFDSQGINRFDDCVLNENWRTFYNNFLLDLPDDTLITVCRYDY